MLNICDGWIRRWCYGGIWLFIVYLLHLLYSQVYTEFVLLIQWKQIRVSIETSLVALLAKTYRHKYIFKKILFTRYNIGPIRSSLNDSKNALIKLKNRTKYSLKIHKLSYWKSKLARNIVTTGGTVSLEKNPKMSLGLNWFKQKKLISYLDHWP